MTELNTHGVRMNNGKHKDELITRVPISYLLWMVNVGHGMADLAKAELDRRGASFPTIEVSGHAIDRASLRAGALWKQTSRTNEGLSSWLIRVAQEAWDSGPGAAFNTNEMEEWEAVGVEYMGFKFVFARSGKWPVLKTIMRAGTEE